MNLASSILGSTAVKYLRDTASAHVLRVGSDTLTRGQLAAVECYNFHAARLLSHVLHEHLKVPNLRYVYEKVPPLSLALPNIGTVSLAVLGAAFEAKRIGGDTPLESYVRKHAPKNGQEHIVTWTTLKHHQHEEVARENKDRKRRKRQRRDKAHELRVDRFEARTAAQTEST